MSQRKGCAMYDLDSSRVNHYLKEHSAFFLQCWLNFLPYCGLILLLGGEVAAMAVHNASQASLLLSSCRYYRQIKDEHIGTGKLLTYSSNAAYAAPPHFLELENTVLEAWDCQHLTAVTHCIFPTIKIALSSVMSEETSMKLVAWHPWHSQWHWKEVHLTSASSDSLAEVLL